MLIAKPVQNPCQAGLDPEAGECCATVGTAIGLVARIIADPAGTEAAESDPIAAIWAAVTS